MAEIKYEVLEKLAVLSESPRGWTKELRLINWNGRGPRYDLREWAPGDKMASRGVTFIAEEAKELRDALMKINLDEPC